MKMGPGSVLSIPNPISNPPQTRLNSLQPRFSLSYIGGDSIGGIAYDPHTAMGG